MVKIYSTGIFAIVAVTFKLLCLANISLRLLPLRQYPLVPQKHFEADLNSSWSQTLKMPRSP